MCQQNKKGEVYFPHAKQAADYFEVPSALSLNLSNVYDGKLYVLYHYRKDSEKIHKIVAWDLVSGTLHDTSLYEQASKLLKDDEHIYEVRAYRDGVVFLVRSWSHVVRSLESGYMSPYWNYAKIIVMQNDGTVRQKKLNYNQIRDMKVTDDTIYLESFRELYRVNLHDLDDTEIIAESYKDILMTFEVSDKTISARMITSGCKECKKRLTVFNTEDEKTSGVFYDLPSSDAVLQMKQIGKRLYMPQLHKKGSGSDAKTVFFLKSFDLNDTNNSEPKVEEFALDPSLFKYAIHDFEMIDENSFVLYVTMECLIKVKFRESE